MKRIVITLYIVVVVVMAAATIAEKWHGTDYAVAAIYGSWWFSTLWALLTAAGVCHLVVRRVRRPSVVVLHLSLVVILAGALLTHLTAVRGVVHLRQGVVTNHYLTPDLQAHALPFDLCLQRFEVRYHEGTEAPADYLSHITVDGHEATISMNHIGHFHGIRLYQSSYDDDLQGSILSLNSDPWGIPVTYSGYALLFYALLWMLVDPRGTYRRLLRQAMRCWVVGVGCWIYVSPLSAAAQHPGPPNTLPRATAERFCRLCMVYNDRVCPVETYAIDLTRKLYGKSHYGDLSAAQVLTGFIFFYDDWAAVPTAADKKAADRQAAIGSLHSGRPLKLFPYTAGGRTTWYAPTDVLPDSMDSEHRRYIGEVFTRLNAEVQAGRYDVADAYIGRMLLYQRTFGSQSMPSDLQMRAERLYNRVPFATWLFMACLTMGLVSFLLQLLRPRQTRRGGSGAVWQVITAGQRAVLVLCLLALSLCLALRWIITGHVPLANGYETMLVLAWSTMLLVLVVTSLPAISRRLTPLLLTFGFLLAGFCLLVSHLSQMDPQVTQLMPVLASPLLTVHVSVIMMAYALLALTFVCAVTAGVRAAMPSAAAIPPAAARADLRGNDDRRSNDDLYVLSQLLLFPAVALLGIGIFVGAIWANLSWGNYWSWDPKETWALITLMVYAVPLHQRLLRGSAAAYHTYMALAFLCVLMTYAGVNYFLGGMHSYA